MPQTKIEQYRLSAKEQKSDFSLAALNSFKTINQYLCSFEGKNVKQVLIRETKTEMTIKLFKKIKLYYKGIGGKR